VKIQLSCLEWSEMSYFVDEWLSRLVRELLRYSHSEMLLWEAGSWVKGWYENPEEGEHPPLEAATMQRLVRPWLWTLCVSNSEMYSAVSRSIKESNKSDLESATRLQSHTIHVTVCKSGSMEVLSAETVARNGGCQHFRLTSKRYLSTRFFTWGEIDIATAVVPSIVFRKVWIDIKARKNKNAWLHDWLY
jgi:hypothetical protein